MPVREKPSARPAAVAALTMALVGLGALNWYLSATPVDTSPIEPQLDPANFKGVPSGELATRLDSKPAGAFQEFGQRPLFSRDRRPVERHAPPTEAPSSAIDLRLVGVTSQAAGPKRALIRFANEPSGKWIDEGSEVNGWKLKTVNERSVVVESGGQAHELVLNSSGRREEGDQQPDPRRPVR